jgi:RHS repeat-associated protein
VPGNRKKDGVGQFILRSTYSAVDNHITSFNMQARRTDFPGYWGGLTYQQIDGYTNIPLFDSQGTTRFAFWFISNSYYANSYILDAFGNLLSTLPTQPNPMQYVGRDGYYTDATGLDYVRARYYDPVNGRFVNRDPIGFDGGDWNLYVYVSNAPTILVDPSGANTTSEGPCAPGQCSLWVTNPMVPNGSGGSGSPCGSEQFTIVFSGSGTVSASGNLSPGGVGWSFGGGATIGGSFSMSATCNCTTTTYPNASFNVQEKHCILNRTRRKHQIECDQTGPGNVNVYGWGPITNHKCTGILSKDSWKCPCTGMTPAACWSFTQWVASSYPRLSVPSLSCVPPLPKSCPAPVTGIPGS